ncbi:energy transducer TonB [Ferruginibacter albus]|uniref:energy transducer TonB n=1 Tax=Ferruginibacter albus TaxID=2875540 RepID=UPI001CC6FED9|nr:energy transducer TonB [Ferruginibacter albus]UAY51566.1 energy transducer TonB [Ferruginibacter albus]
MEANKILSADLLDILFEGKNKDYGAYDLRKTYNKRLRNAALITLSIGVLIFLVYFLSNALRPKEEVAIEVKDVSLSNVKKPDKPLPPPPPPPKLPPPPKVETIKFTPPKVVKDEEVPKDEKPPEIAKVEDTKIDVNTQEGVKDNGVVAPPVEEKGTGVVEAPPDDNTVFTKVEKEAAFPGGDGAWRRYLEKNLNASAPIDNGAPEGTYTVIVKFIVSKDGSISDVEAETHFGYGMEDEAIRAIKRGPKWTPALQNGRNVNAYRRQPITFVVQEN